MWEIRIAKTPPPLEVAERGTEGKLIESDRHLNLLTEFAQKPVLDEWKPFHMTVK
jgi:hypothetical protein